MLRGEFCMVGLPGGGGNWAPPIGSGETAGPLTLGGGFGFTTGAGGATGVCTGASAGGGGTGKSPPDGAAGMEAGAGKETGKELGAGGGTRSAAPNGLGCPAGDSVSFVMDVIFPGASISLVAGTLAPMGATPFNLGKGNWLAVVLADPCAVGGGTMGRLPPALAD